MAISKYSILACKKFKEIRLKQNISVKELAKIARISVSTIYKIEKGQADIHLVTMDKLCSAFNINIFDFLGYLEEEIHMQKGDL